ncbi:hypothetical protein LTR86_008112 [Recurvomyces mirabilis]|nr:hypothetical protein LTR86_008112 [Recurvomyces mirabilis]
MSDSTNLALTITNVVLTCCLSFTLFVILVALHRVWEHVLSLGYLVNQLKAMTGEKKTISAPPPPPLAPLSSTPQQPHRGSPSISWPMESPREATSLVAQTRLPPAFRDDHGMFRPGLGEYESVRQSSPRAFA